MKKLIMALTLPALLTTLAIAQEDNSAEEAIGYRTPIQAILAENNFLDHEELSTITLTQKLNRVESPDAVMITLTESGLLDDSISAIRTTYIVKQSIQDETPIWVIDEKFTEQKCQRGEEPHTFTSDLCP